MTSHVGRLYSLALALFVFFLTWTAIGARPWASASVTRKDPRLAALAAREQRLRHESVAVQRLVKHRWAVYRVQLRKRQSQIAAAKQAQAQADCSRSVGASRQPAAADHDEDLVMESRRFRAMGTDIELLLDGDGAGEALAAAESEFHRLEAILTRFRPDSELSRLNEGGSLDAGPELLEVVELALAARARTDGRFDPTVHDAVVSAGYDRSFEHVPEEGTGVIVGSVCGGAVRIDGTRIELDEGVRLDLGGIGKGYAAMRVAELLSAAGPALVNAGGDIAVKEGRWPVGVETADSELTLELADGGLATSGSDRRRWRRNGRELHHLIDPATGSPAPSDLLRVTVVGSDAVEAEVWAKALYIAGEQEAAREADVRAMPCVLVTNDGRTRLAGGLA